MKLDELARRIPEHGNLLDELPAFIRTADDRDVVRINPIRFAHERSCDEAAVIELFLHARKIGLLNMEWH